MSASNPNLPSKWQEYIPPYPETQASKERQPQTTVKKHKRLKFCYACNEQILNKYIRALDHEYHLECLKCYDCHQSCSSKYFPTDVVDPVTGITSKVPLCEYDFFKRVDLICHSCNTALRGLYITALNYKYHPEHFKCDVCSTVFKDNENFYDHNNGIYCHYHYSTRCALICESCDTAILKQFISISRAGRQENWHPQCFMVNKFWKVSVTPEHLGFDKIDLRNHDNTKDPIPEQTLFDIESKLESNVISIWLSLSSYDESCAVSISGMLQAALSMDRIKGVVHATLLIRKVETLFKGIDTLLSLTKIRDQPKKSYDDDTPQESDKEFLQKKPRYLAVRVMRYLALLRTCLQITDSSEKRSKFSNETLSLAIALAHTLRLLLRFSLSLALDVNKQLHSCIGSQRFINEVSLHTQIPKDGFQNLNINSEDTDFCNACGKSVEEDCIRFSRRTWHLQCFKCSQCEKDFSGNLSVNEAAYNKETNHIYCDSCSINDKYSITGFTKVSRLGQVIYLLKIAAYRSHAVILKEESYSRLHGKDATAQLPVNISINEEYDMTLNNIKRMKSIRRDQPLSRSKSQVARRSQIIETPDADSAEAGNIMEASGLHSPDLQRIPPVEAASAPVLGSKPSDGKKKFKKWKIKEFGSNHSDSAKDIVSKNWNQRDSSEIWAREDNLRLEDIPRIAAVEHARKLRPNAFRHQKLSLRKRNTSGHGTAERLDMLTSPKGRNLMVEGSQRVVSGSPRLVSGAAPDTGPLDKPANVAPKRYSELSQEQYNAMRYVCVFALHVLIADEKSLDEMLPYVNVKKQGTFWEKLFGKGGAGSKNSENSSRVFGVSLEDVTNRYGVESDLSVGPSTLKIPILVDECISAMQNMDMTIEGIFRRNGNIKKLKVLIEQIDANPTRLPDLTKEDPIQLAVLLKKFLRDLPDPLMTFKLYELWVLSQQYKDDFRIRRRILQLTYAMLPKIHRDVLELLLFFFSWVSSFSNMGESMGGSKMDIHNLSTVITPNILYDKPPSSNNPADLLPQGDNYFIAIEVVKELIEENDVLAIIPADIWQFFVEAGFDNLASGQLMASKEIISKCEQTLKANPGLFEASTLRQLIPEPELSPEEPMTPLNNVNRAVTVDDSRKMAMLQERQT
ncbi:BA75_03146T0 [Komagataella pastoris]|uniref:BA75_03146T0 n=1 Tax=Komagataella pastoris TaxID=4922 RepID=A0A1B2JDG8_PICPA|nr:BA75_03146T0 [Komagataella pastoris]